MSAAGVTSAPLAGVTTHDDLPARRHVRDGAPLLDVALARSIAFAALTLWGAVHWMAMLQPAVPGRAWTAWFVALLGVGVMLVARRAPGPWRVVVAIVAVVPLTALAFLAAGVPGHLLTPDRWSELWGDISRGLADLPGARVPYRGLDPWVRTIIPLGGCLLALIAALLAFWPRRTTLGRPFAALIALIALYVVPVVAIGFSKEFVSGAVFTLLTVAYLRLEKLRPSDSLVAIGLTAATVILALLAAPALNADQPWFDYETWAQETSASKSTSYSWDHTYGPLNWPRDGRELLRITAAKPAYWKTENLDDFDGRVWTRDDVTTATPDVPIKNPQVLRAGTETLKVSVRNLRTDQFVTAGSALSIDMPPLDPTPTLDGLYPAPRTLRRGDAYRVQVYYPTPTAAQRRRAGVNYADSLRQYEQIAVKLRGAGGITQTEMWFPPFGSDQTNIGAGPPSLTQAQILNDLTGAGLGRVYQLAQQLKKGARTPEDVVQRVLRYLEQPDFTYTEVPPKSADTLQGFLFEAKTGYCQHYSGAMALLLRMAGIPARVATGFSTGATDVKTGEYVVRDFDAHSWVEVYYPGWGWVTFDPTPAASPARSQPLDQTTPGLGTGLSSQAPVPGDPVSERGGSTAAATASAPWWRIPAIVVVALLVLVSPALIVRRHRRGAPPPLSEFERALRRAHREPAPGTTLRALELRFAATPAAAAYVRALREHRYRDVPAEPTRAERRGLRSELGRGGGIRGRILAWWAVPPR